MKHYISLSQYPGKQGQYFYTSFFKLHNIDADYTPLCATPENLSSKIEEAISSGASGISVSMPFKKAVIDYLDVSDTEVVDYQSCNTIVVNNGKLFGYNADLAGIK